MWRPETLWDMRILHIVATPRSQNSNTLAVTQSLLDGISAHAPDTSVETVELFATDLPALTGDSMEAKYSIMVGQPIDRNHRKSWEQIETLIRHFTAADQYIISCPMWNLSIPYALKYYIDCLVQPSYTFVYNELGQPVPLVKDKKMVVVTSRGGDYSPGSPSHGFDFQEPYLRAIFGFIGITDITFIHAQPMDVTPQLRATAVEMARMGTAAAASSLVVREAATV